MIRTHGTSRTFARGTATRATGVRPGIAVIVHGTIAVGTPAARKCVACAVRGAAVSAAHITGRIVRTGSREAVIHTNVATLECACATTRDAARCAAVRICSTLIIRTAGRTTGAGAGT